MELYLCYYRSIGGFEVPYLHEGTLAELAAKQGGIPTVTPTVKKLALTNRKEIVLAREILKSQLVVTDHKETGLRHSVQWAITRLGELLAL